MPMDPEVMLLHYMIAIIASKVKFLSVCKKSFNILKAIFNVHNFYNGPDTISR